MIPAKVGLKINIKIGIEVFRAGSGSSMAVEAGLENVLRLASVGRLLGKADWHISTIPLARRIFGNRNRRVLAE
jgi:hypothetical protein